MYNLFIRCKNFNEDVSAWDVRRAGNLGCMFNSAEFQPIARGLGGPAGREHVQHVPRRHRLQPGGERAVVHVIGVARDRRGSTMVVG